MEWTKGKPVEPGLYWFAEYEAHGEFCASLVRVFLGYPTEVLESPEYPKPNHEGGGYSGEALRALNDYEQTHPQILFYRRLQAGDGNRCLKLETAWVEAFVKIKKPALPDWLE